MFPIFFLLSVNHEQINAATISPQGLNSQRLSSEPLCVAQLWVTMCEEQPALDQELAMKGNLECVIEQGDVGFYKF